MSFQIRSQRLLRNLQAKFAEVRAVTAINDEVENV